MQHKEKHLRDPQFCPWCGSPETENITMEVEPKKIDIVVQCYDCAKTWQDIYKIFSVVKEKR